MRERRRRDLLTPLLIALAVILVLAFWVFRPFILVFSVAACVTTSPVRTSGDLVAQAQSEISEVAPAALAAEKGTLIIDVSEADEYAAGHLPGAVHVPRGMLEFKIASIAPLQDLSEEERLSHPIVVYCSHGGRGTLSAKTLQDMGYTNVRSLRGGLFGWRSQDLPTESGDR